MATSASSSKTQAGDPVRHFTPVHERDLHLIVVNRDLTTYHHVHPTLDADGTWTIDLPALDPGSYRAVADFQISDGPRLALGTDLSVAGTYRPTKLGEPSPVATVDDYQVTLATQRGNGGEVTAIVTVRQNGELVEDLEPYLGADGHLVAMRSGDLAYAHVHPIEHHGDDGDEPGVVRFNAELSSAGRYAPVLRLPTRRRRAHRLVHLRPRRRHRHRRHGALRCLSPRTRRVRPSPSTSAG